jgi:hypothetical protein
MDDVRELYEVIIDEAVAPFLARVAKQVGSPIPCIVYVCNEREWTKLCELNVLTNDKPAGEVRIGLKPLFRKGRFRFTVEAIVQNVAKGSGFSGFEMDGRIGREEGRVELIPEGHTIRYNVWDWSRLS